jgi:hypothetical protein
MRRSSKGHQDECQTDDRLTVRLCSLLSSRVQLCIASHSQSIKKSVSIRHQTFSFSLFPFTKSSLSRPSTRECRRVVSSRIKPLKANMITLTMSRLRSHFVHSCPVMIHLERRCMVHSTARKRIKRSDVCHSAFNPHLIYDSKWKIPVKRHSTARKEVGNMQNYAVAAANGER